MSVGIWVTGLGMITPLGAGVEPTWTRLVSGERALARIRLFDESGQRGSVAGEVDGAVAPRRAPGWSRTSVMAEAAAREAMCAANVDVRAARVGLVVGGTTGGMFENEGVLARLHAEPQCREMLKELLSHPLSATGDCLHASLGPFARVCTLASACSSGANAIVVAAMWLLAGDVDVAVAGGSDGLCRLTLSGFNALGAIDPEPCRPFDKQRRGTNLGEGSAFLVLERAERVLASNRKPIAELAGWALGAEAHHITNPAADGVVVASLIERAMVRAGLSAYDIDYVNAHGTGTPLNDAMEAAALARALGSEIERIPVSSSKGQIGHTLGGAGAIEAAITALAVARRTLVPTAGLEDPDPALGLAHVPKTGRTVTRMRAALSNAFGFGGMDTVLVFAPAGPRRTTAREATDPAATRPVVAGVAVFGSCGLRSGLDCADLLEHPFPIDATVDADAHLDLSRARRLDRAARLAAVAAQRALSDAGATPEATGVVLGSAYGNVDGSAAFMHRIFEKGARSASPAEFPNLVPSSPVGHVSIYLGLRGPTFAVADLSTSGECALARAVELVAAGEALRVIAGAVEPKSDIVERILSGLFAHTDAQASVERADLAAALVVESEGEVRRRGGKVFARPVQRLEWRGDHLPIAASLQPPRSARAEVILPREDPIAAEVLSATAWGPCRRVTCVSALGENDALGTVALAVAAARIAAGRTDEVLVLSVARGRGHAVLLGK